MADKSIHELPVASLLTDAGLLVVYQDGKTQSIRGELIKQYAAQGVSQYVEEAKTAAQTAGDAAGEAQAAAEEAKGVALYPPQVNPETGMWQTWDAAQQKYVDTDQKAEGPEGPAGSSIQSIERTSGTGAPGTTDTYTVTLTNGSTTTFQVYNGADGAGTGDFKADGSVPMTGALQMAGHTISGLPVPVADSDPVRKQDVPTLAADRKLSNLDTPQTALANLGAGVRPNLGENCNFTDPVNQRGLTSWEVSYGDTAIFDRWVVQGNTGAVTAALASSGLKLSMTVENQGVKQTYPTEYFEAQKVYTSSVIVDGKLYSTEIVLDATFGKVVQYPGAEFSCAITFNGGASQWYPYIDYRATSREVIISCCKLEDGKGQTVGYVNASGKLELLDQDYKKDLELLHCQRCLWLPRFYGASATIGYAVGQSETRAKMVLSLPTTMRDDIVPTVNVDLTKLFFRKENTAINTASMVSVGVGRGDRLILFFDGSGFTTGAIYDVYVQGEEARFEVSCEY